MNSTFSFIVVCEAVVFLSLFTSSFCKYYTNYYLVDSLLINIRLLDLAGFGLVEN